MDDSNAAVPGGGTLMDMWAATQKTIQETWKSMLEKTCSVFTGSQGDEKPQVDALLDQWRQQYQATMGRLASFTGSEAARGVIERIMASADLYAKLLIAWVEAVMRMAHLPEGERRKALSELWMKTQIDLWNDMLRMTVVPPLLSPLGASGHIFESYRQMLSSLYGTALPAIPPFAGAGQSQGNDFYSSWKSAYDETIGKIIRIPPVGPSRESLEKFTRSVDAFFKLYGSTIDFYQKFQQPTIEALEKVAAKAGELSAGKGGPEGFREFFNLVIDVFEARFNTLFKSPAFLHALDVNLSNWLEFKKRSDELIEAMISSLPIPSRSEMNDLYKEIYRMRKQIKQLQAQVEALSEKRTFAE